MAPCEGSSMDDAIFVHSRPVSTEEVQKAGCFTKLRVRIHNRDEIADSASRQLATEWRKAFDETAVSCCANTYSYLGNAASFWYLECPPERLGLASYFTELGFLHDDVGERKDLQDALKENRALAIAMDISDVQEPIQNQKAAKLRKLLSQGMLELIKVERDIAMDILELYRSKWLDIMETPPAAAFQTLEDYLAFRRYNAGIDAFWSIVAFGHGIRYTKEDFDIVGGMIQAAENAMLLTNDYYSWEKEYDAYQKMNNGRIYNAVELFMRTGNLSPAIARERVRSLITVYEDRFLQERDLLYKENPSLPFYLRKLAEVCEPAIAGYHLWSVVCPRNNDWKLAAQVERTKLSDVERNEHNSPLSDSTRGPIQETAKATGIKDVADIPQANGSTTSTIEADTNFQKADTTEIRLVDGHPSHLDASALIAPCNYIQSLPSKRFRMSLIEALNVWLHVPEKELKVIKKVAEMLHSASLMLDDIEDNSPLRRGKTATHLIFGSAQAINSSTFLYLSAVQAIQATQNQAMMNVLLEELQNLYVGQSWDLYWKFHLRCPTKSKYFAMVDKKTGAMFNMIVRLLKTASPLYSTYDFDPLAQMVGRFFQIRDDYMNLQGKEYSEQKGFCEDLDEGKFSFPIVHLLEKSPKYENLVLGIFRQRQVASTTPLARESKIQILECLEHTGTFEATWQLLQEFEQRIENEVKVLESLAGETNPVMHLLLKTLSIPERIGKK